MADHSANLRVLAAPWARIRCPDVRGFALCRVSGCGTTLLLMIARQEMASLKAKIWVLSSPPTLTNDGLPGLTGLNCRSHLEDDRRLGFCTPSTRSIAVMALPKERLHDQYTVSGDQRSDIRHRLQGDSLQSASAVMMIVR